MLEFLLGLAIGAWLGVAGALWRRWLAPVFTRRRPTRPGLPLGDGLTETGDTVRVMRVDEIVAKLAQYPHFKSLPGDARLAAAQRIHLLARRRLPHILARGRG